MKNGVTSIPNLRQRMLGIGLLKKSKYFIDRGLRQNLIARIYLGYNAIIRKGLKFCRTTIPLGKPLLMVATDATA